MAADIAPQALSIALAAAVWEALGRVWDVSFFPPLSTVLSRLVEMTADGLILSSLATSVVNLVIGFGISVVFGVAIGVLMGLYEPIEAALDVYVYALLTAPSLVFAPIFFSIFGTGRASIIALIVTYAIFIIIINTTVAIQSVPAPLVEMARSYNAGRWLILRRVIFPSALPLIMAGLRLGVSRAVKGMINGEMFIAVVGLGRVVTQAGGRFDGASVLAVLIVIIAVAFVATKVVQVVDARVTRWLPATERSS